MCSGADDLSNPQFEDLGPIVNEDGSYQKELDKINLITSFYLPEHQEGVRTALLKSLIETKGDIID